MSSPVLAKKVVAILGPTASGKTKLAVRLARQLNGEIVSADSRQVYRGLDIGSGKDLDDYIVEVKKNETTKGGGEVKIPYHLIDVASPKRQFDLARYQKLAFKAISQILQKGKLPIVCGGSGLYLQCLIDNYQLQDRAKPDLKLRNELEKLTVLELQNKIKKSVQDKQPSLNQSDWHNKRRLIRYLENMYCHPDDPALTGDEGPHHLMRTSGILPLTQGRGQSDNKYTWFIIGINPGQAELAKRIKRRLKERLTKEDMMGEVKRLRSSGLSWKKLENFGLEYKFIAQYLQDKLTYEQMRAQLYRAICQFAKRQLTWFKRMEKQNHHIFWLKSNELSKSDFDNLLHCVNDVA